MQVIDKGPIMTKEEKEMILKPLDYTKRDQQHLVKFNLSDIRSIAKALEAKLIVH